ncbi:hypothetical protein BS78_10G110100 [Paspalum vaginatum]|nr:hypothetical protein BS78_10G110100 [Paspalum vaginatum]
MHIRAGRGNPTRWNPAGEQQAPAHQIFFFLGAQIFSRIRRPCRHRFVLHRGVLATRYIDG